MSSWTQMGNACFEITNKGKSVIRKRNHKGQFVAIQEMHTFGDCGCIECKRFDGDVETLDIWDKTHMFYSWHRLQLCVAYLAIIGGIMLGVHNLTLVIPYCILLGAAYKMFGYHIEEYNR